MWLAVIGGKEEGKSWLVGVCLRAWPADRPPSVTLMTAGMCYLSLGASVSQKNSNKQHLGKGAREKENILNCLDSDCPEATEHGRGCKRHTRREVGEPSSVSPRSLGAWGRQEASLSRVLKSSGLEERRGTGFGNSIPNCRPV